MLDERPPRTEADLRLALKVVLGELQAEALKRVGDRQATEQRWLEDICAYHGRDDEQSAQGGRLAADTLNAQPAGSRVVFNRTRRKTRAMAARLKEMLFPADDSNWSIEPTPSPELAMEAEKAVEDALKARTGGEPDAAMQQAHADRVSAIMDEATRRCDAMRREIEDMLVESRYEAACRRAIDDAVKIGAGFVKGPVKGPAKRRRWEKPKPAPMEPGAPVDPNAKKPEWAMAPADETVEFRWVDPWGFFPNTNARSLDESEDNYERHLMNAQALKRAARDGRFDPDATRRLLKAGPQQPAPSYVAQLRNIVGDEVVAKNVWQVWEFTGSLTTEQIEHIAAAIGDEQMLNDAIEADPLDEMVVNLWFCGDEVLRFNPYWLDSGETIYSSFVLEPDEASVFGSGVPRIMRDNQIALKAAWRAMLDNAGYALGPHIIVNDEMVEPMDGSWNMRGPKMWKLKGTIGPQQRAFDQFQVQMNQEQLANIIVLAERFIDEETGLPQISMGEQTEATTKTMGGMALLLSQGALVFREIVKRFDDGMTVPSLQRAYDWLMQFSPKEAIKGDAKIKARGVSNLVTREIESQNLLLVSSVYGPNDPDIKADKVKKAVFRALSLDPDEYIRTPAERQEFIDSQQQGPSPEEIKAEVARERIDADVAISEMRVASERLIAEKRHETAMMTLAETLNMKREELEALLQRSRFDQAGKDRTLAAEIAMSEREAARADEDNREPMGSGGYVA